MGRLIETSCCLERRSHGLTEENLDHMSAGIRELLAAEPAVPPSPPEPAGAQRQRDDWPAGFDLYVYMHREDLLEQLAKQREKGWRTGGKVGVHLRRLAWVVWARMDRAEKKVYCEHVKSSPFVRRRSEWGIWERAPKAVADLGAGAADAEPVAADPEPIVVTPKKRPRWKALEEEVVGELQGTMNL